MPNRTTWGEDLIFMLGALWILIGLGLDGWAHANQPELESFFTPWHGVFYSGFIASAAWVAFLIMRRRPHTTSFLEAVPDAYRLSLVGLGIFAVGGVGDGFWHTIFGIETSIDALLSPTHLVMLFAMLLAATAPLRNSWHDPSSSFTQTNLKAFLPPLMSVTFVAVAVSFFHWYTNGFDNWWVSIEYLGPDQDYAAARGVLATLTTTVILIGSAMVLLRRWRPPMGSFVLMFGFVGFFMALLDAFGQAWQIMPAVVGGLVMDLAVARSATPTRGARVGAVLSPLFMWSVATIAFHIAWGVGWTPELWVGQIVMASLAGLGLSLIAFPPEVPAGLT